MGTTKAWQTVLTGVLAGVGSAGDCLYQQPKVFREWQLLMAQAYLLLCTSIRGTLRLDVHRQMKGGRQDIHISSGHRQSENAWPADE